MLYYGARYYDPGLGRFISADTLVPSAGDPQALNRYNYARNNPLKYTDPSGHCWGAASGVRSLPSYDVTCGNMDMALTIVQHPNASGVEKAFAGWYLVAEGTAHVSVAVGGSILGWQAIAPATAVGEAACMDGDCTNEARGVGHTVSNAQSAVSSASNGSGFGELFDAGKIAQGVQTAPNAGVTVLGRLADARLGIADYRAVASQIGANALSMPNEIWNSITRAQQWAVNQSFLDLAIKRGDRFQLSYSYDTQMQFTRTQLGNGVLIQDLPFFSRELLYLQSNGYQRVMQYMNGQWIEFMQR